MIQFSHRHYLSFILRSSIIVLAGCAGPVGYPYNGQPQSSGGLITLEPAPQDQGSFDTKDSRDCKKVGDAATRRDNINPKFNPKKLTAAERDYISEIYNNFPEKLSKNCRSTIYAASLDMRRFEQNERKYCINAAHDYQGGTAIAIDMRQRTWQRIVSRACNNDFTTSDNLYRPDPRYQQRQPVDVYRPRDNAMSGLTLEEWNAVLNEFSYHGQPTNDAMVYDEGYQDGYQDGSYGSP